MSNFISNCNFSPKTRFYTKWNKKEKNFILKLVNYSYHPLSKMTPTLRFATKYDDRDIYLNFLFSETCSKTLFQSFDDAKYVNQYFAFETIAANSFMITKIAGPFENPNVSSYS